MRSYYRKYYIIEIQSTNENIICDRNIGEFLFFLGQILVSGHGVGGGRGVGRGGGTGGGLGAGR